MRNGAACLGLIISVYLAWHTGGRSRDQLAFAAVVTGAISLAMVVRSRLGRPALVVAGAMALWTAWSAVSALASASPSRALPVLPVLAWYGLLALGGAAAARAGEGRALTSALMAGAVVQVAVGLFDRWGAESATATASGTFYNLNQYGGFLALLLPLAVGDALSRRRFVSWSSTLAASMVGAILLSGSRGGLLCALSGLGVVVVLTRTGRLRRLLRLAAVACGAVALAWVLSSSLVLPSTSSGSAGSVLAERSSTAQSHATERVHWWLASVRIWKDEPLLGTGPGTYGMSLFTHQETEWKWSLWAHNAYAQALAETGVLGLACLIVAVGGGLVAALRARRRSPMAPMVLGALVAGSLHIFIDVDFEYPAFSGALFLLIGLALGLDPPVTNVAKRVTVAFAAALLGLTALFFASDLAAREVNRFGSEATVISVARTRLDDAFLWRGVMARRMSAGDLTGAREAALEVVASDGLDPDAWVQLGHIDERMGMRSAAIESYRTAAVRHPANPGLRQLVATTLWRDGQLTAALGVVDEGVAIMLDRGDRKYQMLAPLAHLGAVVALEAGDEQRARHYLGLEAKFRGSPED